MRGLTTNIMLCKPVQFQAWTSGDCSCQAPCTAATPKRPFKPPDRWQGWHASTPLPTTSINSLSTAVLQEGHEGCACTSSHCARQGPQNMWPQARVCVATSSSRQMVQSKLEALTLRTSLLLLLSAAPGAATPAAVAASAAGSAGSHAPRPAAVDTPGE